jgi:hypothetical protein
VKEVPVRLDDHTYEVASDLAERHGVSLSELLAQTVESLIGGAQRMSAGEFFALSGTLPVDRAAFRWSRGVAHERGSGAGGSGRE